MSGKRPPSSRCQRSLGFKKILLQCLQNLALHLLFMVTSARIHDICCFTCTDPYVRTCVTSENKAFMLVPVPGLCF